jgi:hypothetical protein
MYCLITDETNLEPSQEIEFFIYGGLFFPIDAHVRLNSEISKIRDEAGYHAKDKLKFDTRVRPSHVTVEAATEAKKQVVSVCLHLGCRFIVYVILHELARNETKDNRVCFGCNSVLARFQKFLRQENEYGIVLADTLPVTDGLEYLRSKFGVGLTFPDGQSTILDRITLYGMTTIGASHSASAVDIVLGSFRYCVNNPKNRGAAGEMMRNVVNMMWHTKIGDTYHVGERGLILRPLLKNIEVEQYRERYDELVENINSLLKDG